MLSGCCVKHNVFRCSSNRSNYAIEQTPDEYTQIRVRTSPDVTHRLIGDSDGSKVFQIRAPAKMWVFYQFNGSTRTQLGLFTNCPDRAQVSGRFCHLSWDSLKRRSGRSEYVRWTELKAFQLVVVVRPLRPLHPPIRGHQHFSQGVDTT